MRLEGKSVLLGVTGGIAAYKAPEIVRSLRQRGARVRVVLTQSALEFVTPLSLQTVSGEKVSTSLFDLGQESEIGHIQLADGADVVLIAPATANVIGKCAAGLADDLLTTILLATRAPVVVAPAMNVHMYENSLVQENLSRLAGRGWRIVEPDVGSLACGYEGLGRLPDPNVLLEEVSAALAPDDFARETVLITAGPTREPIDPVRFVSNRSSGKMGFALARAAARRGARVVLVTGPTSLADPRHVRTVRVETAEEMARVVRGEARAATVVIAAAAVADFRPSRPAKEKAPKKKGRSTLELEATPDVIATAVPRGPGRVVVGFAAETTDLIERARGKLERKALDLIVANDVTAAGAGFDVETNLVTLIDRAGTEALPLQGKDEVADAILDRVARLRTSRQRGQAPSTRPRVSRSAGRAGRRVQGRLQRR
ncbi:MAG: bifunctional phosphopantothenoylcysteine decarboxylase/phosphopantothenate--cysteine ligase CoaBC [Deltaproteobacteria bacterium]|nr:bifunctional phosphopantothenoylcysteine decarboxylase/phosphopantothenate--cysteine ligase CoaBC [Deltaproteobacteria bacterium]